ncbi:hypothetical protein MYX84_00945 [Acidobacteria bacterium AH-259-O06]|nr:hypothetical protein [Acidobacteria bacterium AH-259-O06]
MPLKELKKLRDDIQTAIDELEALPEKRKIDLAAEHSGKAEMIHEIIDIEGESGKRKWTQWETIYCSPEKCSECPHGPFMFTYRANKKGTVRIVDYGIPAFDIRALKEMEKHIEPPIFEGTFEEFKQLIRKEREDEGLEG